MFVALRKESVDRNKLQRSIDTMSQPSLSARRAWIEMEITGESRLALDVALRKESVDRNLLPLKDVKYKRESLSARRAWIEILVRLTLKSMTGRRSPQGERG